MAKARNLEKLFEELGIECHGKVTVEMDLGNFVRPTSISGECVMTKKFYAESCEISKELSWKFKQVGKAYDTDQTIELENKFILLNGLHCDEVDFI